MSWRLSGDFRAHKPQFLGRIGRALLAPLYAELHTENYRPMLSPKELPSLRWRTAALAHMQPRHIRQRHPFRERLVYAEASGKSPISAAAVLTPGNIDASIVIDSITASAASNTAKARAGGGRSEKPATSTEGLGILERLAIFVAKNNELRCKTVTFYIGNKSLHALIRNSWIPIEIQALTAPIWHRIRDLRTAPRFGRVHWKRNIADRPTRHVKIKYASLRRGKSHDIRKLNKTAEHAIQKIILGAPLGPPR